MSSRQLTKNFLSLFLSNVIGQVLILLAFVRIATLSGPEGFGRFSFAQVFGLYFLYLADFGLQTLGTRSVAQDKSNLSGHVRDITILRIILAAGSFLILGLLAAFLKQSVDVSMILVFGMALFPSAILLEWVFQGTEEMEYVGLGRVLKGLIFAACVYLFVRTEKDLVLAAWFYVAGIVGAAVVLLVVYFLRYELSWQMPSSAALKKILILALPLAAGSFITQVDYNFGTVALGTFASDETVGLFSASYKIVLFLWAFAVVAASNAVLPLLARSHEASIEEFRSSLHKLLRLFILIAIPLGIGGTILARDILGFLYAPEFQKGAIVFQISIWAVVFVIYRVVFENALIASSNQRTYLVGYLVAGVITVAGNIILTPMIGLVAPSIVGIVSELALLSYFVASSKFIAPLVILRLSVKPLIAGLGMGVALVLVPLQLMVSLAAGTAIYLGLLLASGYLTMREIQGYVQSLVR